MGREPIGTSSTRLLIPLAMVALTGFGLSVASAQTGSQSPTIRPANARSAVATSGSGQYYFEFRSRQAWDYGHTFVVFGRVGEPPSKNNVAGLSPKGDDPQMWLMGHYVPVPSDTGWTDGDLEDKYITALPHSGEQGAVRQNRRLHPPAAGQIDNLERGALQLQRLCRRHRKLHGSQGTIFNLDLSESLRDQYAQDQYRASGSRRRARQRECERDEQPDPGWPRDDR
jgi:hypothetical protein